MQKQRSSRSLHCELEPHGAESELPEKNILEIQTFIIYSIKAVTVLVKYT